MRRFNAAFCLFFCLLLSTLLPAEEVAGEAPGPTTLEELEAAIVNVVSENEVPAVGLAMVDETGPI